MNIPQYWRLAIGCVCVAISGLACSGSGNVAATAMAAQAAPIDALRAYCIAAFPQDFDAPETPFTRAFTAKAGEEYVIASFHSYDGNSTTSLLYLTPAGFLEYSLRLTDGAALPYTTACDLDNTTTHYAVLESTTVFKEVELKTALCELPAGTVRPVDPDTSWGSSMADFDAAGDTIYEITLNAYSATCGGAENGFVRASSTRIRNTTSTKAPFTTILGPA